MVMTCNHHENVGHINSFACTKRLLVLMRSLVACVLGNFEFKKIEGIIHIHKEKREKTDEPFQSAYTKAVSLANEFGIEGKLSESCGHLINWKNITSETVKEYWPKSVYLLLLKTSFS